MWHKAQRCCSDAQCLCRSFYIMLKQILLNHEESYIFCCSRPRAGSVHDGMPDAWEREHGLDPANPADRNGLGSNGYTNLENYLNSIAL